MAIKYKKYTKEFLEPLVLNTTSITKLIAVLGLKQNGGNYRLLQQRIRQHNISTDHFGGQDWSKGLTKDTSEAIAKSAVKRRVPDADVFCENSYYTTRLKKRLLNLGWLNECNICKITEWLGRPITLHVDHINGISNDNRLSNLQILCPNCHQQTDTWGNTNGSVVKLVSTADLGSAACDGHESSNLSTPTNKCIDCKSRCSNSSVRCKVCESKRRTIKLSKRPLRDDLILDLKDLKTYIKISNKYGVSDVTVKKWCDYYALTKETLQ